MAVASSQPTDDTRTRLLDAAEALFGEQGIQRTSLRAITERAEANLAAVNYYFRSKEALIHEVLDRRLGPINEARLELLDELERSGDLTLESILRALVAPFLELEEASARGLASVIARLHFEQNDELRAILVSSFREVAVRFAKALQACCPHLEESELLLRLHFAIGSMAICSIRGDVALQATRGVRWSGNQNAIEPLVQFLCHGFSAPAVVGSQAT